MRDIFRCIGLNIDVRREQKAIVKFLSRQPPTKWNVTQISSGFQEWDCIAFTSLPVVLGISCRSTISTLYIETMLQLLLLQSCLHVITAAKVRPAFSLIDVS